MSRLARLWRDTRGTGAIEMAIVVPVLVSMLWGIFQIGILFQSSAGMQHALGEAARYATLHPTPTDTQIKQRVKNKTFGTYNGTLSELEITNYNAAGQVVTGSGIVNGVNTIKYKDLSLVFAQKFDVLFMAGPTVTLTRKKRVYLSA